MNASTVKDGPRTYARDLGGLMAGSGKIEVVGPSGARYGEILTPEALEFVAKLQGEFAERRHQLRPGITVETQAAEIADLLFYDDLKDVVLTGTSAGGMVLCRTAEMARDRIGRLAQPLDAASLLALRQRLDEGAHLRRKLSGAGAFGAAQRCRPVRYRLRDSLRAAVKHALVTCLCCQRCRSGCPNVTSRTNVAKGAHRRVVDGVVR